MVAFDINSSTQETETGASPWTSWSPYQVPSRSEVYSETLSQKKLKKRKRKQTDSLSSENRRVCGSQGFTANAKLS